MNDFIFKVADIYFRLTFNDTDDARHLLPSYAPFHVCSQHVSSTLHLTVGNEQVHFEEEGKILGLFDCGDAVHCICKLSDGGYKILIFNTHKEPACAMRATSDFSQCEASLFGNTYNQCFGLNNAAMIAFAFFGAYHGILLMHASVTMHEDKGYLFLGKSGTGKSTHSALWRKFIPGCDLLNDDNPAVRFFADGRIFVYGTPWSGKTPCYRNLCLPIGAFVHLEQHPENIICREKRLQAFATILSSCSSMIWDKPSYDAIINSASGIAAAIPVYRLKCRPDEEAVLLCKQTITTR